MPVEIAVDVLVAGGGPAGIAAACAAAESGARTCLIDDNWSPGGQIWRGDSPDGAAWLERLHKSGASWIAGARVFDIPARGIVSAGRGGELLVVRHEKLILATGARERFLPFPGWTLPNVTGAGGLQAMVKGGFGIAGKRVVVAGTGPLLVAVAAFLRSNGAEVALVAEQAPRSNLLRFGASLAARPGKLAQAAALGVRLAGTRYLTGCWPVSASGDGKLESVTLRRGEKTWNQRCDYLACGWGLVPNIELPLLAGCELSGGFVAAGEWQETSVAGIWCAGEPTGIGGVDYALTTGLIAGYAAAGLTEKARRHFPDRARAVRFLAALRRAFTLREELKALAKPDTIVCRCEDVPLAKIGEHASWRAAKLQTRCGMGPCQGRVCGPALEFLFGWRQDTVRPPVFPIAAEHLAGSAARIL